MKCTVLHSEATDEAWSVIEGAFTVSGQEPAEPLDRAVAGLTDAGIDATLVRTAERATPAIVHAVLSQPCDLVLVGKRAHPDADGPRLGSTASKLLRKCPCAVWAVHPNAQPPPTRILAATDLSAVGESVLERAVQIATAANARLDVVHAVQLSMAAQLGAGTSAQEFARAEGARARGTIEQILERLGFSGAHLHVGVTSPTRAVLEGVSHLQADLVVMGTISRGGVPGLLLGNTAERLLSRLGVSLLTLKPADFVTPIE